MQSRLGEEGLPKQDLAGSHYFHSSSSRLSKGSPPEREKPLAWASTFSLSESWATMRPCSDFFCVIGWMSRVWLDYCIKACSDWLCMSDVVHGLWMMGLVWSWHVIQMRWLISKWHGIDMKYNSIFMVWEGWVGMDSTFGYEWGRVEKAGMRLCAW